MTTSVTQISSKDVGFFSSSIGSKMVMAITGLGIWLFLVAHLLGNLTLYFGAETFNGYAELLASKPALVWLVRIGLLVAFPLHIYSAIRASLQNQAARPQGYAYNRLVPARYAAKSMMLSGATILAFLLFHLAHFTWQVVGPMPATHDPYQMVVLGFQNPAIVIFYLAGQFLLAGHLSHGLYGMWQHLGVAGPRFTKVAYRAALVVGYGLCAAFASIPIAVFLGVIK